MLPVDRHGVYAVLVPPEPREIRLCGDELNTAKYGFNICGLARREEASVNQAIVHQLTQRFATMDALYIADGHHRMAPSARLAESTGAFADAPKAWCLAFIVPQEHLHIHNFDRAVTSLSGMDTDKFLDALRRVGELDPLSGRPEVPPPHGHVHVCTRKGWYTLTLPHPSATADASDRLDASILSDAVLDPVLGIHDLRTEPHVRFVPGTAGVGELERMVKSGEAAAAFNLRPVSFEAMRRSGMRLPR